MLFVIRFNPKVLIFAPCLYVGTYFCFECPLIFDQASMHISMHAPSLLGTFVSSFRKVIDGRCFLNRESDLI